MEKTGLSLGGGCLRGAAHIGVLQELTRQNTMITHLAGTSAGAVVGGLYASGMDPDEMQQLANELSIRKHLDVRLHKRGWLKGDRIYNTLLRWTDGKHFSDLDIPFAVVCVDLYEKKLVILQEGEVAKAIRASISIPGIFSPVSIDGRLLVDGYILNNNPADVVKQLGATHVTAVQILSQAPSPATLLSQVNRYMDIASSAHTERIIATNADVHMKINLNGIGRFSPRSLSTVIKEGKLQARRTLGGYGQVISLQDWQRETLKNA